MKMNRIGPRLRMLDLDCGKYMWIVEAYELELDCCIARRRATRVVDVQFRVSEFRPQLDSSNSAFRLDVFGVAPRLYLRAGPVPVELGDFPLPDDYVLDDMGHEVLNGYPQRSLSE